MPLSLSLFPPSERQNTPERRHRSERVDYKALHTGRPFISYTGPAPKKDMAGSSDFPPSYSTRTSLSAQRSAAREQKLRSDPLVDVHGPMDVTCRRCGTHIKLSTKSTYDPFHWHRHIERCSKRPAKVLKIIRDGGKLKRKLSAAERKSSHSPHEDTPPLTADEDSNPAKEKSPSPNSASSSSGHPSSPSPETPTRLYDTAFDEYFIRSRRRPTREFSPLTYEGSRSWSWAQLKEPFWVTSGYYGPEYGREHGDGYIDDPEPHVDRC